MAEEGQVGRQVGEHDPRSAQQGANGDPCHAGAGAQLHHRENGSSSSSVCGVLHRAGRAATTTTAARPTWEELAEGVLRVGVALLLEAPPGDQGQGRLPDCPALAHARVLPHHHHLLLLLTSLAPAAAAAQVPRPAR